jgi:hypothetical protein
MQCVKQDGGGDGTVPISSRSTPHHFEGGAVKQKFGLTGFEHEGAYRNSTAQIVTLYALQKIMVKARVPS